MNKTVVMIKRWLLCCLLFFAAACTSQTGETPSNLTKADSLAENKKIEKGLKEIKVIKSKVRSADFILRTGKDYTSRLIKNISVHDKTYSHAGIASWENDTLFVYHAIGGEWNPDQKIRRDVFELFCNPYENRGFGIYRYQISNTQQKSIINYIQDFYHSKITFDMQFDLGTDNKMYCTELVYKTIKRATSDSVNLLTTTQNNRTFVAVDNLFMNPFCGEIKRISFTQP
jgi:hypothetical protein